MPNLEITKNKIKFEFQRMLKSMKEANLNGKSPINPFISQIINQSSPAKHEGKRSSTKVDIHDKFVNDIVSYID